MFPGCLLSCQDHLDRDRECKHYHSDYSHFQSLIVRTITYEGDIQPVIPTVIPRHHAFANEAELVRCLVRL